MIHYYEISTFASHRPDNDRDTFHNPIIVIPYPGCVISIFFLVVLIFTTWVSLADGLQCYQCHYIPGANGTLIGNSNCNNPGQSLLTTCPNITEGGRPSEGFWGTSLPTDEKQNMIVACANSTGINNGTTLLIRGCAEAFSNDVSRCGLRNYEWWFGNVVIRGTETCICNQDRCNYVTGATGGAGKFGHGTLRAGVVAAAFVLALRTF